MIFPVLLLAVSVSPRVAGVESAFRAASDSGLSRLKRPQAYPVVFSGLASCLAGRMGDFRLTGRHMGDSPSFGTVALLAFSFRPSRRVLVVNDRLRFRADSGRFVRGVLL